MKWIGQHIWDFISRFRNDVYLENLSTSTDTAILVVDTNGKVTKNASAGSNTSFTVTADSGSDQTIEDSATLSIAGGTGISTVVGAIDKVTVNVDASQTGITLLTGVRTLTVGTSSVNGVVTMYLPTTDPGITGRLYTADGFVKVSP